MRSRSLLNRVGDLEARVGRGYVTLTFDDGTTCSLQFRNAQHRLRILLAAFYFASRSYPPPPVEGQESDTPSHPLTPEQLREREIALLFGRAVRVDPPDRLWETIGGVVRNALERTKVENEHGEADLHASPPGKCDQSRADY
jgi:hypothetical protein